MISKIWLIQKSDGEFIDYVYTTKQLAECRTRHQQDGATLTIQEWVLADRPALSRETPDPRRTPDPLIPQIATGAPECSPFPVMDHYREEQLEAALSAPQVGENVASLSAEEIFIRTVIRLTCNDGCEHNEECEQDKIDDYVRTQLPRLLAAERDRARRETKRMSSFQKGTKVLIRGEVLNDLQDKLGFVIVEVGDAQGRTPAIPASLLTLADRPAPSGEASRNVETNRRYGHKDDCKFGMENSGFCSCGKGFGEAKVDAQATFDALKKSREPHAPDMRTVDSEGFIESAPQAGEDDLIWARHYLRDGGPHDAAESTEEAAKLLAAERAAERNRWEREHRMCSVCCGNPLPSGRACICGGVGTEIAEAQGLRMEVMRLDKQVVDERNRAIEDTEKLRADLKEAQAGEEALDAKLKSLAPHGTCACSYDSKEDVCEHHSPQIAELRKQLAQSEQSARERARNGETEHYECEPTQEQKFYRVITDEEPCKHCFAGHTWTIAWTENGEEVSIGESFGDQDEAQSYCNDMNMAFNAGFAKLRGEAPERTPEGVRRWTR